MFEKEINLITERVKKNTINESDFIDIKTILESNIPIGIKDYFFAITKTEFNKEIKENASKFTDKNSSINELEKQREKLIIKNKRLTKNEFENILEYSINFNLNLLCRPQWTLENLLFQEKNLIETEELFLKLDFVKYYKYFPEVLKNYAINTGKKDFARVETEKMLRNIDEIVTVNHTKNEIAEITKPIFEFIEFSEYEKKGVKIPIKSLVYFYQEKGKKNIVKRLDIERRNNIDEISFEDLKNLVEQCDLDAIFDYTFVTQEEKKVETERPLEPLFTLEEEKKLTEILFFAESDGFENLISEVLKSDSEILAQEVIREYFATNNINPNSIDAAFFERTVLKRLKILIKK